MMDPAMTGLQTTLSRSTGSESLRHAAEAFEAIFLQQVFDRLATSPLGTSQSGTMALVDGMFRAEVAATSARGGGVGIAELLLRQWGEVPARGERTGAARVSPGEPFARRGVGGVGVRHGDEGWTGERCGALCAPYPLVRVIGEFDDRRPGGRMHAGMDFAGIGPDAGLGTPVRSMARERVVRIGRPEEDPERYGRPMRAGETVVRGGQRLPSSAVLPTYGEVRYFTEDAGRARTGAMLVTEIVDGPYAGHRVRYMHLGAIHPALRVGDEVAAGTEIGVMGGTAVQSSSPHVHVDMECPQGRRVDFAPLLGAGREWPVQREEP
jgi:murein DD-endopeptidase MepM/ murein hydrolase activator NlpD